MPILSLPLAIGLCALLTCFFPAPTLADAPYYTDLESYQDKYFGQMPTQSFRSTDVLAPIYQINHWDASKIDSENPFLFMSGYYGGWGASIVSAKDLSLVWADQCCNSLSQASRVWMYKGEPVLVSYVDGRVRIYDQSYHLTHILEPQGSLGGLTPDSHEAALTGHDTVLMIVCPAKEVDLTPVGGPEDGKVLDCHVQEFDPDTKEVLFQFSTLAHFGPEDSVMDYHDEDVWDYCHMNSIEKTSDGNFIVSYRHLSTVILINGKSGDIIWIMGGKKNMFTDISEKEFGSGSAEFHFQHEPRFTGPNRFTLFDNHRTYNGFCNEDPCSRGLELEFDPEAKTVWMVKEWFHPQRISSGSRGGVQRLPGSNNTLVAWGQNPLLTEYTADGELAMDVQRGQVLEIEHGIFEVLQYRIWKGKWEGNPRWPPAIGCYRGSSESRSLYVSWNGATKVDHYALLSAEEEEDLDGAEKVVAQSPRNGFETKFDLHGLQMERFARIAALDGNGTILGSTSAVDVTNCEKVELDYNVTEVLAAGAASISGVPSSTAVLVPSGTGTTAWGIEDEDDEDEGGSPGSASAIFLGAGAVAGAVAIIAAGAVALVYCIRRWRRSSVASREPNEASARYGLLEENVVDEEYDDKDEGNDQTRGVGCDETRN